MNDIAPVRTLPVADLANQLGSGAFTEWDTYEGQDIGSLPVERLLSTDPKFLAFWTQRCAEEVLAFERILAEGEFLNEEVVEFFDIPSPARNFLGGPQVMREWAETRLAHAREAERALFS